MATERTTWARLLDVTWLLLVFETALLLDDEDIVFWGGLALAAGMGVVARLWWFVPLIPMAFIVMLNIHVRLFGEIVKLPPEYGWEVEFAPLVFAVYLWFSCLFAASVGTFIGYALNK